MEKGIQYLRAQLNVFKAEVCKGCTIRINLRVVALSLPFFPLSAADQHRKLFGELFASWRGKAVH